MGVSLVASSTSAGAGTTGTAAVVCPAPALPTGTVSGDRVFYPTCSVGQPTAPSGWTELINLQVGGGTIGASTGPRYGAVFWRDYDGAWSMPTVTAASTSGNTIVGAAVALRPGAGEALTTPAAASGSDTTADTSMSVTATSSLTVVTSGSIIGFIIAPAAIGTQTSPAITLTGATFSTSTNAPSAVSNTTGNDATLVGRHQVVTGGATGAPVYTATIGNSRTVGVVFVAQGFTTAPSGPLTVPARQLTTFLPAVVRASRW